MRTVIQKKTRRAIIFYAPLGKNTPPGKIGGAEAGCLKTKAIYEKSGINVIALDKPAVSKGIFRFVVEMALVPLKLFFYVFGHINKLLSISLASIQRLLNLNGC